MDHTVLYPIVVLCFVFTDPPFLFITTAARRLWIWSRKTRMSTPFGLQVCLCWWSSRVNTTFPTLWPLKVSFAGPGLLYQPFCPFAPRFPPSLALSYGASLAAALELEVPVSIKRGRRSSMEIIQSAGLTPDPELDDPFQVQRSAEAGTDPPLVCRKLASSWPPAMPLLAM